MGGLSTSLPTPPPHRPPSTQPTHPLYKLILKLVLTRKKSAENAKDQAFKDFKGLLYELIGIVDYIAGKGTVVCWDSS